MKTPNQNPEIAKFNHASISGETRKINHDTISDFPLSHITPSPENDTLYKPVDTTSADFKALVESVKREGIKEPLVLTTDGYIISGHRRYAAACAARLHTVPCRVELVRHDSERFLQLLREYNRQRIKTVAEMLRESVVDSDPEEAYRALLEHRSHQSEVELPALKIEGTKTRARITSAKEPMLRAVLQVLADRRRFWPLSARSVHYALLNAPPLKHAKKADSIYRNDERSYNALLDLATRARLVGRIPMSAITDPTRPVIVWDVHDAPQSFFNKQLEGFLKGYRRNLQQSQPNHIEILGEKNTIESTLRPVASHYNIPLTIARGFSSLEPRYKMAQRFKRSGKEKLILLVLTDFDPSGEEIMASAARSLRDDFDIEGIHLVKVALNGEQVARYNLPPLLKAKTTDSRAKNFTKKHGSDVWELEALPPETLQEELTRAIDSVLDIAAFNQELDAEKSDAAYLATVRNRAAAALKDAA